MIKEVFDTHVHIWNLQKSPYSWLQDAPLLLQKSYSLEELDVPRLAANVTAGILVQADNTYADTRLMLEASKEYSWIKGVVGWLPLMDPELTETLIEKEWSMERRLVGVRHLIHNESSTKWLLQTPVLESLAILAKHAIPFEAVAVLPEHLETAIEVSGRIPSLKIVLDHLSQPPIRRGEKFGEWGKLMKVASAKNVFHAKLSGLGTTAGTEMFTEKNIEPYIQFIVEHFGVDRIFCGGDWPVSLLGKDYVTTWNIYKNVLRDFLTDSDCNNVLYKNAVKFYNI